MKQKKDFKHDRWDRRERGDMRHEGRGRGSLGKRAYVMTKDIEANNAIMIAEVVNRLF
jgi:hypothetical protein